MTTPATADRPPTDREIAEAEAHLRPPVPEGFTVEVFHRPEGPARRRVVAIIGRPGKHGPHLMSFTFAPTEVEARRKAANAIESWLNPAKKSKQPTDLDTVPPVDDDDVAI